MMPLSSSDAFTALNYVLVNGWVKQKYAAPIWFNCVCSGSWANLVGITGGPQSPTARRNIHTKPLVLVRLKYEKQMTYDIKPGIRTKKMTPGHRFKLTSKRIYFVLTRRSFWVAPIAPGGAKGLNPLSQT